MTSARAGGWRIRCPKRSCLSSAARSARATISMRLSSGARTICRSCGVFCPITMDAGADYLLAVKANHPGLMGEIERFFDEAPPHLTTTASEVDKGHGRPKPLGHRKFPPLGARRHLPAKTPPDPEPGTVPPQGHRPPLRL